uniref:Uncharacterized protein n=1 Tax=Nelumbo nucifera TaxID=4432 RepID=A0A822ZFA5_NELNU|nr:TPA_asm: hypothetical protein HUJ06_001473 [Nelumbo nucifera]
MGVKLVEFWFCSLQVYSLEDGPVHVVWRNVRMPVTIVNTVNRREITVDWFAVSEALKRMYGVSHGWNSLPPMPMDGDTWSVMQSWVLPTRSFVEFVMFSRLEDYKLQVQTRTPSKDPTT